MPDVAAAPDVNNNMSDGKTTDREAAVRATTMQMIEEKGLPVNEVYEQEPLACARAHVPNKQVYEALYKMSLESPTEFWTKMSYEQLRWMQPWRALKKEDFSTGDVRWFIDGKLNAADCAVDRWAEMFPDRLAIVWEGDEPTNTQKITYKQLLQEVCQVANLLKLRGVKKGDTVTIYMPMIPKAAVCMLACARLGAIHSVVFAGFSATALRERIQDARSKVLITADNGVRGGKMIKLKEISDQALADGCGFVDTVLLFKRAGDCDFNDKRDVWADELLPQMRPYCPPEVMDSEDLLFMLYTSGSTGKPKGIAHSTGGYLTWASMTHKYVFDVHPGDMFACVADVGWITGHSYIVYGPLTNGATTFMFESVPTYPGVDRYWDMIERHRITHFYTAPTAIRAVMRFGDDPVKRHDRSSLRVLGSVGEPINPEAWRWYHQVVGNGKVPIMDTFWQTETGGFMLTPITGSHTLKPGSATLPFFGVEPAVLDPVSGQELTGNNVSGILCFKRGWPGMLRTIFGDHERMLKVYYKPYPGYYLTGDGCVKDNDGYFWITGRIDDVINVSGHRIGSAEVEHSLMQYEATAETAVVGFPHDIKGEGIVAYVILKQGHEESADVQTGLKNSVRNGIGPFAQPDRIVICSGLPKTRSGKIMRRILRKIASGDVSNLGDTSTLADPAVVEELIEKFAARG